MLTNEKNDDEPLTLPPAKPPTTVHITPIVFTARVLIRTTRGILTPFK